MDENILEIRELSKYFGTVCVLKNINLSIRKGEIHGLVGANGSGKSTLMNILFGNAVIAETGGYEGGIYIEGKKTGIKTTKDAINQGIGMIHQEFALIPDMTIAENIKISRENTKGFLNRILGKNLSFIDKEKNRSDAEKALKRLGLIIDTNIVINKLSTNSKQFVEIAREVDKENLKMLFLDEPTAVLNESDSKKLLQILKGLSENGTSIVFISHRLEEICEICDRVTVLRDGEIVSCYENGELSLQKLAEDMIGCSVNESRGRRKLSSKDTIMEFKDFCVDMPGEMLKGVNLEIFKGEILGIASLSGHGKLALGYGVVGYYSSTGEIIYKGSKLETTETNRNIDNGVYFLPDDRKSYGLLLEHSIMDNIIFSGFHLKNMFSKGRMGSLGRSGSLSFLDKIKASRHVDNFIDSFEIKCKSRNQRVRELSGGNQQKVCMARALTVKPDILFVSEPTRGVDIGAKEKILDKIVEINESEETTIIIASSELEELRRVCDRIAVLSEGKVSRILRASADESEFALALSGEVGNEN